MTWEERLQQAEVTGLFTPDDKTMAGDWATCSVGEAVPDVSEENVHSFDSILESLGLLFGKQVYEDDVAGARLTHELILEQAKELRD